MTRRRKKERKRPRDEIDIDSDETKKSIGQQSNEGETENTAPTRGAYMALTLPPKATFARKSPDMHRAKAAVRA